MILQWEEKPQTLETPEDLSGSLLSVLRVYVHITCPRGNLSRKQAIEKGKQKQIAKLFAHCSRPILSVDDDITIPVRALLARRFPAVRRDLVRALVEDLSDRDGDVDAVRVINFASA